MMVDERAERFRPLFNDEYSRDALVGLCIGTHTVAPAQRIYDDAAFERPAAALLADPLFDAAGRRLHADLRSDLSRRRAICRPKVDRYNTTRGVIGLAEYNRLAREIRPPALEPDYRHLCETWVKYHAGTPLADELYKIEQANSRLLKGKGSSLRRADVEKLRNGTRAESAGTGRCRSAR